MFFLAIIILLMPAVIGVVLYERFRGYELIWRKRIELYLIFTFLLNLAGNAYFWLRGWDTILWTLSDPSHLGSTVFVTQYMVVSLISAVILAFMSSLVRFSKIIVSKINEADKEEDDAENGVSEDIDNAENSASEDKV